MELSAAHGGRVEGKVERCVGTQALRRVGRRNGHLRSPIRAGARIPSHTNPSGNPFPRACEHQKDPRIPSRSAYNNNAQPGIADLQVGTGSRSEPGSPTYRPEADAPAGQFRSRAPSWRPLPTWWSAIPGGPFRAAPAHTGISACQPPSWVLVRESLLAPTQAGILSRDRRMSIRTGEW
jgi:hypothetical protein